MHLSDEEKGRHHQSDERRRHPRTYLGLPVRVHFAGDPRTITLELVDVSLGGAYFRTSDRRPRRGQWLALGFVTGERQVCAARGRAVRVDESGFALAFDAVNSDLRNFLEDLANHVQRAA
jgi:PilZ domain